MRGNVCKGVQGGAWSGCLKVVPLSAEPLSCSQAGEDGGVEDDVAPSLKSSGRDVWGERGNDGTHSSTNSWHRGMWEELVRSASEVQSGNMFPQPAVEVGDRALRGWTGAGPHCPGLGRGVGAARTQPTKSSP